MSGLEPKVTVKNVNFGVERNFRNRPKAAEAKRTRNLVRICAEDSYCRQLLIASEPQRQSAVMNKLPR